MAYGYYDPYQEEEDPYGFGSDDVNNIHQQNFFDNMGDQGLDINMPSYDPQSAYDVNSGNYGNPQQYNSTWTSPFTPGGQSAVQGPAPIQAPAPQQPDQGFNRIKQIADTYYTPSTAASTKFNQMVDQFPQYEKPGIGRRIVAGLSTLAPTAQGGRAGMANVNDILYGGYNRDVAAWKEHIGPAQAAAQQENAQNVNERQLATNMATQLYNQERAGETQRSNQAKEDIARQKNEIAYLKTQGATFNFKGKNVIAMLPDGSARDTGVPTTNFSPIEQAAMEIQGKKDVTNIQGQTARDVQASRGMTQEDIARQRSDDARENRQNAFNLALVKGAFQMGTKAEAPGVPQNAKERGAAESDTIKMAGIAYPQFSKYIETVPGKDGELVYRMKTRPVIGSWLQSDNADREEQKAWDTLASIVYGKLPGREEQQAPPPQSQPQQPQQPQGKGFLKSIGDFISPPGPPPGPIGDQIAGQVAPPYQLFPSVPKGTNPGQIYNPQQGRGQEYQGLPAGWEGPMPPPAQQPTNITPPQPAPGVRPGFVWVQNLQTGQTGWMPEGNVAAAEASKGYKRVQ